MSALLWEKEAVKYGAPVARVQVWDAFANAFLDTRYTEIELQTMAKTLAESPFSIDELAHILMFEVGPGCFPSTVNIAGESGGFSPDLLIPRCLEQQRRNTYVPKSDPSRLPFKIHFLSVFGLEAYLLLCRASRMRSE